MNVTIFKCQCNHCSQTFYEWEHEALDNCPHCSAGLFAETSVSILEIKNVILQLDSITGHIITN